MTFSLRLLGCPGIDGDAGPLTGPIVQRRRLALLAPLALAQPRAVSRDKLLAYLWPEDDAERARHHLADAVYAIRKALGRDALQVAGDDDLLLDPAVVQCDVAAFERAVAGRDWARAAEMYAGPFLDGFFVAEAGPFEEWAEGERRRLAGLYAVALEALAEGRQAAGDPLGAVVVWRRLAVTAPCDSRIACGLMRALVTAGDRAGALQHARIHTRLLQAEFGAAPDPDVTALVDRLRRGPPAAPLEPSTSDGDGTRRDGGQNLPIDGEGWAAATVLTPPAPQRAVAPPGRADATARPGLRPRRRVPGHPAVLLAGAALAVAVVAGLHFSRFQRRVALDADLVAVAPFDVLASGLGLWREGLMDVLSRNLDGAGPLRTVPPSVVARPWDRRADAVSARELGRRTGAGLVVFGQMMGTGTDSVRVTATVLDVATGGALAEVEGRDRVTRMDRLADSVTVRLLRELGQSRPIGAVRRVSLGWSHSLTALKAFLQGEQLFRRGVEDSAVAYYERAVAEDSTFALALRRLWVVRWDSDEEGRGEYALRAGRFNHGLPPRESLLVSADSILAGMMAHEFPDSGFFANRRRLLDMMEVAARRYPDDPEIWFELGEARIHAEMVPMEQARPALEAFTRAIALDSAFAPTYTSHTIELALRAGDSGAARRYATTYLALRPSGPSVPGMQLLAKLLDPAQARSPEVQRLLDTLPAEALSFAFARLLGWPDSAETAVRVARRLAALDSQPPDSVDNAGSPLALALARRGHLRAAYATGDVGDWWFLADLGVFGVAPPETVTARFARNLRHFRSELPLHALASLGWWAAHGDTASLLETIRLSDSLIRPPLPADRNRRWFYVADAARAYLALAHQDSTDALRRFMALPDSLCSVCYFDQLTKAELLVGRRRYREAAVPLEAGEGHIYAWMLPRDVLRAILRGRVSERLGDQEKAIRAYRFVLESWRHADPELQPYVAEARAGLARLTREPRP
jgi:DNA-binding SARP family transcriptional activator